MLYRCLIFLRQTGLWEQMWETIRLNLNLNLNLNKNSLFFRGSIDEKKLSKYIKYCKLQQKTSVKIILYIDYSNCRKYFKLFTYAKSLTLRNNLIIIIEEVNVKNAYIHYIYNKYIHYIYI